jgi:2-C-methyl-D-erythritol 4-phosphate cytidylyltransferase
MARSSAQTLTKPPARVTVLIPAAGSGRRMGEPGGKALLKLGGVPLIRHTVECFQTHPRVESILLVVRRSDADLLHDVFWDRARWSKLLPWIPGGEERQDSVRLGLDSLAGNPPDWVLVHDGARPLCSAALIDRVLDTLAQHGAVVPTLPVHDTVRRRDAASDDAGEVVDRAALFLTQTPQGFHWRILADSHAQARERGVKATDDAHLVALAESPAAGGVVWVPGERRNIKITSPADLMLAEWILSHPDWGQDFA